MLQAAAAALTFNLICTGTMEARTVDGIDNEPYRYEYRIDLQRGKWCEGDCRALHDFVRVSQTQLTLEDVNIDTPHERRTSLNLINRETGEQRIFASTRHLLLMEWRGTCERAAFSGFPTLPTRF